MNDKSAGGELINAAHQDQFRITRPHFVRRRELGEKGGWTGGKHLAR
jgi:hypothetical protein